MAQKLNNSPKLYNQPYVKSYHLNPTFCLISIVFFFSIYDLNRINFRSRFFKCTENIALVDNAALQFVKQVQINFLN